MGTSTNSVPQEKVDHWGASTEVRLDCTGRVKRRGTIETGYPAGGKAVATPVHGKHVRPASTAGRSRAVRGRYCLSGYSWSSIASIMRVPIGSLSKGMKFLVRIKYNLSMPFGVAASCFNPSRRSSLVFMNAVIMRLFQIWATDRGLPS